jgi:diguanylate cyclase (GGDEF)-like protein
MPLGAALGTTEATQTRTRLTGSYMSHQEAWGGQRLAAQVDVLAGLERDLARQDESAQTTVRAIAALIGANAERQEFADLTEHAAGVQGASPADLAKRVTRLVAALRGHVPEKLSIMVVSGYSDFAESAQHMLASPDRAIHVAGSAARVRELLGQRAFSLLVLDIVLPDADGRNFIIELRQHPETETVPIVVLSGPQGGWLENECLSLGANAFLEKPVEAEALCHAALTALCDVATAAHDRTRDELTGLLNRAAVMDVFSDVAARSEVTGVPFAVALLEVDRFEQIQETSGQGAAEAVLRKIGVRLTGSLAATDLVARWQGDRYVVLFPNTECKAAATRLTDSQALLAAAVSVEGVSKTIEPTVSAGVVPVRTGDSIEHAVAAADELLFKAGTAERGRVFTPDGIGLEATPEPAALPKILLAEDDRVSAALVQHRLTRAGFEVIHYPNGAEALAASHDLTVAMCIFDVKMPEMDGLQLLERLRDREEYARVPILMLTSMGREEDIVRAFKLGATDYMTKPFSPVELLARVHRLLRAAAVQG